MEVRSFQNLNPEINSSVAIVCCSNGRSYSIFVKIRFVASSISMSSVSRLPLMSSFPASVVPDQLNISDNGGIVNGVPWACPKCIWFRSISFSSISV